MNSDKKVLPGRKSPEKKKLPEICMFDSLPLVRCFSVAIYVITSSTNMFVSNLQMGQKNLSYAKDEV